MTESIRTLGVALGMVLVGVLTIFATLTLQKYVDLGGDEDYAVTQELK